MLGPSLFPPQSPSTAVGATLTFTRPSGLVINDTKITLWLYKNGAKLSETVNYLAPTIGADISFQLSEDIDATDNFVLFFMSN